MFSGCVPDVSPLRVIGCLAIPHTADRFGTVDKTFTPRSTGEWVLVGYTSLSLDITGYILYDRVSGRTAPFDLGAVKFSELIFPCHSTSNKHIDELELDLDENSRDGLGRLRVAPHHSPSHVAGGDQQAPHLQTLQGGTLTAKMRSLHLTTMFPSLPRPRYPTFLRFQDWSRHDHRLRCYCHRSL
jgi:hypothetical protein